MSQAILAWLGLLGTACALGADPPLPYPQSAAVEAQFRGCDAAGWCRFWIDAQETPGQSLLHVRPDGVAQAQDGPAVSVVVRDRLNALLASMIHQHKRIVLHGLHALDDGTFSATVLVNGANVADDPSLLQLRTEQPHSMHR